MLIGAWKGMCLGTELRVARLVTDVDHQWLLQNLSRCVQRVSGSFQVGECGWGGDGWLAGRILNGYRCLGTLATEQRGAP